MSKTDNSFFIEKVILRLDSLPDKSVINILDAYSGEGKIWDEVKKHTEKKLRILKIEKQKNKSKSYHLNGDNIKFMKSLDFRNFDIIDLDAYGIPFEQLEIVLNSNFKGIIHVTAISSGMGRINNKLLMKLGFSKEMIKKIPSIFNRNLIGKLINYLYLYDVQSITGYFIDRKNYFYFKI